MLIILPPSETKAPGGTGAALDVSRLFLSEMKPQDNKALSISDTRRHLAQALAAMPHSPRLKARSLSLLGLKPSQEAELEHNESLLRAPTMPAIERYTGVAFDALDVCGARTGQPLSGSARQRLAIGSALFGVVAAEDPIPYYRLSAGSKLMVKQGRSKVEATVRSQWSRVLTPALVQWQQQQCDEANAVIDLRSGGYHALGPVPGALTLRVETEYPDGKRKVVSHFNKHYKGLVARELASSPSDFGASEQATAFAEFISAVPHFAEQGFRVEVLSNTEVTLVVPSN